MVGAAGFEPATTCPPCRCATRLRYAPTQGHGRYERGRPGARRPRRSGARFAQALGQLPQFRLDLVQHQLAIRIAESQLDLGRRLLALVEQRASRTRDRVAARVEQLLDAEQELD